ncbi:MAG: hypothetical protein ACTHXA_04325 [Gulosibacter sp.]|uniref:hypothetical protein n=1 Tax=Gulosibacter sp. TaxID=2817531 RepID=UPI003F91BF91
MDSSSDFSQLDLVLEPVEGTEPLELPDLAVQLTASQMTDTLPSQAGEMLDPSGSSETEEDSSKDIRAAAGETFLVAELSWQAPTMMPMDYSTTNLFEFSAVVDDEEVGLVTDITVGQGVTGVGYPATGWVVLSVPENSAPEDVVLDVTFSDRNQQLSLIDGSRVHSDLEEHYHSSIEPVVEDYWWEIRDEASYGEEIIAAGFIESTQTAQILSSGLYPWADPGHVFVGITTNSITSIPQALPTAAISLTLADGSTIETFLAEQNDVVLPSENTVWFMVPLETESAVINIHFSARDDAGDTVELGTEEIPIHFLAEE